MKMVPTDACSDISRLNRSQYLVRAHFGIFQVNIAAMLLSERTSGRVLRRGYSSSSKLSFDSTNVALPPRLVSKTKTHTMHATMVRLGTSLLGCYYSIVRLGSRLLGYGATSQIQG